MRKNNTEFRNHRSYIYHQFLSADTFAGPGTHAG